MRSRTVLAAAATALAATGRADADLESPSVLFPRQQSDPSPSDFVRRGNAKAIVAGQNLYIIGGAVSYRAGGNVVRKLFVNTTLSLPLDQDWKASDVSYKSFPPPDSISHSLYDAGLWVNDESENDANPDVYLWGGSYYRENEPGHGRDRNLWTMQTKADGTGKWGKASVPSKIKQTGAGTAASCGGKGYMIGGWGSNDTDPNFSKVEGGMINVPGLISYDFTSSDWNNHSIEALTQAKLGTYGDGAAICVKTTGTSPKLFVVGGTVNSEPSGSYSDISFLDAQFWDPDSEEWYKQETSGDRPEPRKQHCAVGVPGPNNTFDIFMYGGDLPKSTTKLWILSLPAFRWFSIENDPDADSDQRKDLSCVRVGSQMVVVGGNNGEGVLANLDSPDKFGQGLGILDMNTGTWKSEFSKTSPSYEGPRVIRDWYKDHGYDSVNWDSDKVASFFSRTSSTDPSDTTESGTSTLENDSAPTPVGAIAGGVVGGVVGLALIGAATWFLVRRRRRQRTGQGPTAEYHAAPAGEEQSKTPELHQYGSAQAAAELEAGHGRSEMDQQFGQRPRPPAELP